MQLLSPSNEEMKEKQQKQIRHNGYDTRSPNVPLFLKSLFDNFRPLWTFYTNLQVRHTPIFSWNTHLWADSLWPPYPRRVCSHPAGQEGKPYKSDCSVNILFALARSIISGCPLQVSSSQLNLKWIPFKLLYILVCSGRVTFWGPKWFYAASRLVCSL